MKRIIISFAVAALLGTSAYATCTIQYNCGTGATGTTPANQTVSTATNVFTPSAPGTCAKDGYVFSHWQVSSTSSYLNGGGYGTMYDAAWAGTEYTIPFTTASDTCSNRSATINLTAQWVDASYTGIPTSKSYVDTGLNAKQPKFDGLGNNKLMVYSDTTDGAVASRDIVTTLGTSTTDTSVPTRGAIVTGLNTKQNTVNGTAGYVMTNTGTAGSVGEKPVYSTTHNYKNALVEAGTLNQTIIDAVNSELIEVPEGWQINTANNLSLLSLGIQFLDASIEGTSFCYRGLSVTKNSDGTCSAATLAALGSTGNKSGMWGVVMPYGDIVGKSVCSATAGTEKTAATDAQESNLTTEFNAQTGNGNNSNQMYCWCKMESVNGESAVSRWVFNPVASMAPACAANCANRCGTHVSSADSGLRSAMFSTLQQ